jgi:hypothetical protein
LTVGIPKGDFILSEEVLRNGSLDRATEMNLFLDTSKISR